MEIEIIREHTYTAPTGAKITRFTITCDPLPEATYTCFGVDPGVTNIGIAFIYPPLQSKQQTLWRIQMERHKDAVQRMVDIQHTLEHCIGYFGAGTKVIIEGASYGKTYRQVELAEARAAIALWFYNLVSAEIKIVPPNTIRKAAFGSGNLKNPWSDILPNDVVAALGCALYGYKNIT